MKDSLHVAVNVYAHYSFFTFTLYITYRYYALNCIKIANILFKKQLELTFISCLPPWSY